MYTLLNATPNIKFAAVPAPAVVGWGSLMPHREYLVRYAERRLLDPALAEDLVHDVFEAVMTGRASFAGRSALRSWLVAVLKHKIVDLIRDRAWHQSLDALGGGSGGESDDGDAATWEIECPAAGPEHRAEQRERLQQTLSRIDRLPAPLREALELRVIQDRDTDDICRELAISSENLFVRLHRARKQLAS
jgi:RNA polymerase sigma-70 factor (ECF subfamily)